MLVQQPHNNRRASDILPIARILAHELPRTVGANCKATALEQCRTVLGDVTLSLRKKVHTSLRVALYLHHHGKCDYFIERFLIYS